MVSKFTSATSESGVRQDDWQIDVSNKQQLEFSLGPIAISNLSIRISPALPRDVKSLSSLTLVSVFDFGELQQLTASHDVHNNVVKLQPSKRTRYSGTIAGN